MTRGRYTDLPLVSVGVAVAVTAPSGVSVGVAVSAAMAVDVGVLVRVAVEIGELVSVAVGVAVLVGVPVAVEALVGVLVGVAVAVIVSVGVLVKVAVGVGVGVVVLVEVGVGVLVGGGGRFMFSTTTASGWAAPMNAVPSQLAGMSSFSSVMMCTASPGAKPSMYSTSVRRPVSLSLYSIHTGMQYGPAFCMESWEVWP
jgi:hypothetical protein